MLEKLELGVAYEIMLKVIDVDKKYYLTCSSVPTVYVTSLGGDACLL